MSLGFTWAALGLSPCWVIKPYRHLARQHRLHRPPGDDKNQSTSKPYFLKIPCSLAIHNGATLLLIAPCAISNLLGCAARAADPSQQQKRPNSDRQNLGSYSHF